jgi:ribose transport system permease protein
MTMHQTPGNTPGGTPTDSSELPPAGRGPLPRPPAGTDGKLRSGLITAVEKYALLGFFVVAIVIFGETATGFLTTNNIQIVLGTQAPLAIIAVAATLPLIVGQFDLSVVAIAGISSIVLATTTSRSSVWSTG